MSAILKFDFQKRKQLHFSEVNYLNYTKKDPILHVATTFSLKQGETKLIASAFKKRYHCLSAGHKRNSKLQYWENGHGDKKLIEQNKNKQQKNLHAQHQKNIRVE